MASPAANTRRKREPSTVGGSRKRTLACIGIGLAAAPLLSSIQATMVQASPVHQHRVPVANRQVTYGHLVESRPRDIPSKFWYTQPHEEKRKTRRKRTSLEVAQDDQDHIFWSLIADASHQHPLSLHHSSTLENGAKEDEYDEEKEMNSIRRGRPNVRRDQVTDKFVEDSTSAFVVHGADDDSVNNVDTHENYPGYNVTAEYDESSSVLTSSSKLPTNSSNSIASNSTYQPLRIRAVLSENRDGGEYLTTLGRKVLLKEIIRPALLTWSAALRLEPVVGNLTVDKHQLFDDETCGPGLDSGLPSPKVPSHHLSGGIPETDMVLYLSIGFAPSALANFSHFIRNTTGPVDEPTTAPNSTTQNNEKMTSTKHPTGGDGGGSNRHLLWDSQDENDLRLSAATSTPSLVDTFLPGEDEERMEASAVPLPTADPDPDLSRPLMCAGDYVAAASYCSTDQYDRPTAGMLHICIDETFFLNSTRNKQIVTIRHEVGHALGFNAKSMAHFRRPDGSPITPRVNGEIVETNVECTGPSSDRRSAMVPLPSEEILQFRTVRGGVRVAEVVTPSVLQVVRNHFDCQNLSGAELESGEYSPLSGDPDEEACIGDHWERRLFQNDIMNPVVDGVEYSPFISTLTLAYFADSGWYQVDLSMAELAASWGRGAGCSFVEETCIGEDGTVPPSNRPFFCNAAPKITSQGLIQEIDGCTADLYRKAACSLGRHDTVLPPEFQYFGTLYDGTVGGSDPFMDYCPTYAGFENGLCSSQESATLLKVNTIERFGVRNSRCLSGLMDSRATALCLPIACVVEDRSLHVKVDGIWRLCEYKDQELKVLEDQYVVCPDPRRVCPTFYCHHDCLGTSGGRCDYGTGACICNRVNGTNASLGLLQGNSTNTTGVCRRGHRLNSFALAGRRNRTLSEMPHEDSPLSDYYVPFKESLRDDQLRLLSSLQLIILLLFLLIFAAALFWYFRLRHTWKEAEMGETDDHDNNAPPATANPNKDKMIATVLVDMRINAPDVASVAPTADTASSLCEVESAASVDCTCENDDRSLASEGVLEDSDVLATNPTGHVRKRRFKRGARKKIGRN